MMSGMMMGSGMMGGSMMGGGMREQTPPESDDKADDGTGQGEGAPAPERLVGYIQGQGLACLACHATSGQRAAPSFEEIARRYSDQDGSETRIADSVAYGVAGRWAGYPPMPGGQASPAQADELARLILRLTKR